MKIQNRERFLKRIAAIPGAIKEEVRAALKASAEETVDLMKRTVPVEHGDLKNSIIWQFGDEKKVAYSQTLGTIAGSHELSVRISAGNTKVRYAHLVEFGTAPHINAGKFAGSHHPGTAKQPFFFPSYRLTKKRAKDRIARAARKAVKKAVSGG